LQRIVERTHVLRALSTATLDGDGHVACRCHEDVEALQESHDPDPTPCSVGQLCYGGDWACARGDLDALGDIARCLADRADESLRRELAALADACRDGCDPARATATWDRLKERCWMLER
jgi:hypothetical protein